MTTTTRRRRRQPAEAEAEIVAAARAFLCERPFRDLTVDEIMRRTELSRPSFYVYFKDRYALALHVLEDVGRELFAVAEQWFAGTGDPRADVRQGIDGTLRVWAAHAAELRALAHAAKEDAEVARAWASVVEAFVDAATHRLEQQIAAGTVQVANPRETARALIFMNQSYCLETVGLEPPVAHDVMLDTLLTVWSRTLYGRGPDPAS